MFAVLISFKTDYTVHIFNYLLRESPQFKTTEHGGVLGGGGRGERERNRNKINAQTAHTHKAALYSRK